MENNLKVKLKEGEAVIRTRITRKIVCEIQREILKKVPKDVSESTDLSSTVDQKNNFVLLMLISLKINGEEKEINMESVEEIEFEDFETLYNKCEEIKSKKKSSQKKK